MYTITIEIATQHIQELRREADTRRLAELAPTPPNDRTRRARNGFGWPTVRRWHVASAQ